MGAARVTVIGAGVIGLTCALRLREAGYDVSILARDRPLDTTSAVAAAIWYPYLALPKDRVAGWAATSYRAFTQIAVTVPEAGIRVLPGREIFRITEPDPWWMAALPDFRRLQEDELPAGYVDGWGFLAPTIDMPRYLGWLVDQLHLIDIEVTDEHVTDVAAVARAADAVVVCAGLGARELLGDREVVPVRGQVAVLDNPGLSAWLLDDSDAGPKTYVIPRRDTVIVGGTTDRDREDVMPDRATGERLVARARELVPMLNAANVLDHQVGLRPTRSTVRLETDPADPRITYCYGHGGAGVTLSWGCADEVVALLGEARPPVR